MVPLKLLRQPHLKGRAVSLQARKIWSGSLGPLDLPQSRPDPYEAGDTAADDAAGSGIQLPTQPVGPDGLDFEFIGEHAPYQAIAGRVELEPLR